MRICVSCGRRAGERPLRRLPGAMSPDLGICDACADQAKRRAVTRADVEQESDRLLAGDRRAFVPYLPPPTCGHCGGPVLYDRWGRQPAWCGQCELARLRLVAGGG